MRAEFRRGLRVFSTIRMRSALLAALVVGAAMTIGAFILIGLFRNQLESALDQTLQEQATDRVLLLDQGSDPQSLVTVLREEALVWIGQPDGTIVAVGGAIVPLENPIPSQLDTVVTQQLLVEEQYGDEAERELAELRLGSAQTANGELIVLAGAETDRIDDALGGLARLFSVAVPLLALLVGATTWLVAGRVLNPVERIRAHAADMGGGTLADRVPVPDTRDEIHDLATTMNSMLDRIESHELALRQFGSDASHELKSPIANLRALVDTADSSDPDWPRLQVRLTAETERLNHLVANLLFLSTGGELQQSDRSVIYLDDLVFDEAEILSATERVSVNLEGVEPVQVVGVGGDLRRLIRNLLDNATRHAASTVRIQTEDLADGAVLTISDDGEGIPPEDRERVFERFTRLDEARARDDGGSGLGLAIVRQIALDHDAAVTVTTSDLGGAQFTIEFPRLL